MNQSIKEQIIKESKNKIVKESNNQRINEIQSMKSRIKVSMSESQRIKE